MKLNLPIIQLHNEAENILIAGAGAISMCSAAYRFISA